MTDRMQPSSLAVLMSVTSVTRRLQNRVSPNFAWIDESKLSEVDMCSCGDGFCAVQTHIVGAEGRLYLIEKTLPKGAH